MQIFKINKISKIIAEVILATIVLLFITSELGQSPIDNDRNNQQIPKTQSEHSTDYYCVVLKGVTHSVSKNLTNKVIKLQVQKTICLHRINETNHNPPNFIFLDPQHYYTSQKATDIYLFNQSFLI